MIARQNGSSRILMRHLAVKSYSYRKTSRGCRRKTREQRVVRIVIESEATPIGNAIILAVGCGNDADVHPSNRKQSEHIDGVRRYGAPRNQQTPDHRADTGQHQSQLVNRWRRCNVAHLPRLASRKSPSAGRFPRNRMLSSRCPVSKISSTRNYIDFKNKRKY